MTIGQDDGENVPALSRAREHTDPNYEFVTVVMDDVGARSCLITLDDGLAVEARTDDGDRGDPTNPDDSNHPARRELYRGDLGFKGHRGGR